MTGDGNLRWAVQFDSDITRSSPPFTPSMEATARVASIRAQLSRPGSGGGCGGGKSGPQPLELLYGEGRPRRRAEEW